MSAFTGATDDGKYLVYYVDMTDSATQQAYATLLFEDVSTHEPKQITGDVSIDDEGSVVINGVDTDKPLRFLPGQPNDDGSIPIIFEDYGTATVVVADPATVRDTIDKVMDEAAAK